MRNWMQGRVVGLAICLVTALCLQACPAGAAPADANTLQRSRGEAMIHQQSTIFDLFCEGVRCPADSAVPQTEAPLACPSTTQGKREWLSGSVVKDAPTCSKKIRIRCDDSAIGDPNMGACCRKQDDEIEITLRSEDCKRLGLQSGPYCKSCIDELVRDFHIPDADLGVNIIDSICLFRHEYRHALDHITDPAMKICESEQHAYDVSVSCLQEYRDRYCHSGQLTPRQCEYLDVEICEMRSMRRLNGCICSKIERGSRIPGCLECEDVCAESRCGSPSMPATLSCQNLTAAYCTMNWHHGFRELTDLHGMDTTCGLAATQRYLQCLQTGPDGTAKQPSAPGGECLELCTTAYQACYSNSPLTDEQREIIGLLCSPFRP